MIEDREKSIELEGAQLEAWSPERMRCVYIVAKMRVRAYRNWKLLRPSTLLFNSQSVRIWQVFELTAACVRTHAVVCRPEAPKLDVRVCGSSRQGELSVWPMLRNASCIEYNIDNYVADQLSLVRGKS